MNYLIAILATLLLMNIWISRRVWRHADDLGQRKLLLLIGVWIIPFLGAFIANQQTPLPHRSSPHALHSQRASRERGATRDPAPAVIQMADAPPFDVIANLATADTIPILDWRSLEQWALAIGDGQRRRDAIEQGRRAWLLHLRERMGPYAHLLESDRARILSTLEPYQARVMAEYLERTRMRIAGVLKQAVDTPGPEKIIALVFDSQEAYYRYVGLYYPEEGEFALSGGMFINGGCPHFVLVSADLSAMEPVIVHEMTHHAIAHLELPKWLDEGIAVNTEYRLAGARHSIYSAREMRQKHRHYWNAASIQAFWSGRAFDHTDDGQMLSYELARILVEQMALHWEAFCVFVRRARREDAGSSAARQAFSFDLGALAATLLEVPDREGWSPDPASWSDAG